MAVKPSSFFVESWEDNLDDEEFFNPLEPDIRFKHLSKKVYHQSKISEYKTAEIRKYFNRFDTKKYGFINSKYIVDIFKLAGQNPDLKLQEKLLNKANQSNTGMIIFSDMMNLFGKYWKPSDQIKKEIRDALKEFDTEGNEIIQIDKLIHNLQIYGDKLDADDIEGITKYLKSNNKDGKILIDDFMKIVDSDDKKFKPKKKKDKSAKKQASMAEDDDEEEVKTKNEKPKIKKTKSVKQLKK